MPEISAPLSWVEIFLLKKVLGLLNLVLFYLESELLDHDLQNEDRGGRPKKFEPFSSYLFFHSSSLWASPKAALFNLA